MQLNICEEEGSRESLRLSQEAHEGAPPPPSGQHFHSPWACPELSGCYCCRKVPPKRQVRKCL